MPIDFKGRHLYSFGIDGLVKNQSGAGRSKTIPCERRDYNIYYISYISGKRNKNYFEKTKGRIDF